MRNPAANVFVVCDHIPVWTSEHFYREAEVAQPGGPRMILVKEGFCRVCGIKLIHEVPARPAGVVE